MSDLNGKIAVITGASRGIGAATARLLAARGAAVAVTYREREQEARAVAAALQREGGQALSVRMDISSAQSVGAGMKEVADRFGALDVLINNAGAFGARPFEAIDFEFFQEQFTTNVWGTIQVTKAALPLFRDRGGRIVNLSSQRAFSPKDGTGLYAATKAAVSTLTQAMAIELGPRGITVNAVAPAVTRTEMTAAMPEARKQHFAELTPMRRLGEPEDVARVIAFLASEDAGWITGRTLLADGGITGV